MTSEVCIMNRLAVVIAADSAMTVSGWVNGQREERYFKGTNKIFQLSKMHPVGMMIFDSANLQGVPWEIIAKDFRSTLAAKSFNTLPEYANELFQFVTSHQKLFPQTHQDTTFVEDAEGVAYRWLTRAADDHDVRNATNDVDKSSAFSKYALNFESYLNALPIPVHFSQSDIDAARQLHFDAVRQKIALSMSLWGFANVIDVDSIANLAITGLFKEYKKYMSATGVVIAGFGDHEYFPSFFEYQCYGILSGKFIFDPGDSSFIDHKTPAQIKAFATTGMVDTFQLGFSPDVFSFVQDGLSVAVSDMFAKIGANYSLPAIPDLSTYIEGAMQSHTGRWTDAAIAAHGFPLRRVIGSLPLDEMAELAETLINLQSLKEKVTKPTESVGGPVDVAIITKGDGFIWVKRKHYFDPALNRRFFTRDS